MILATNLKIMSSIRITRTCGGDPFNIYDTYFFKKVLPAHAGVILRDGVVKVGYLRITRTCGGDPIRGGKRDIRKRVLPAHAGVIPTLKTT